MRGRPFVSWRVVLIVCAATLVTACSSVQTKNMLVNDLSPSHRHPYKVHVKIAYYADQSDVKDHGLTPAIITEATQTSIRGMGLFDAVVPTNEADYTLSLVVNPMRPKFQMGPRIWYMTDIDWTLVANSTGRWVYSRKILYTGTCYFCGPPGGSTAQERAVQGNIRAALQDIGNFDIRSETRELPPLEKGKDP